MNSDHWADWLLNNRHGGDAENHCKVLAHMAPVRGKAHLRPLVEAGTGRTAQCMAYISAVKE
ncbi:MAG TPA: hypothetical protein VGM92_07850 [Candidatus Kapabacteria bacterium]